MLELNAISKTFDSKQVLRAVSLSVAEGEIVTLLGPSGCGKSTLLQIIAGLMQPDAGDVQWDNQPLVSVPPHLRNFGLMFQDYALFPHKSVAENVAFGLKTAKKTAVEQKTRITEMLQLVGLSGFEDRDVNTLSGGEQQRVALARSLAPQPKLLMLDEPLGALDRALRETLLDELRQILRSLGQTTIYVTHDQEEAFAISDRMLIMNAGEIVQAGPPQHVYATPNSEFTARFLGFSNVFSGVVSGDGVQTDFAELAVDTALLTGAVTKVLIRPEQAQLSDSTGIPGVVTDVSFRGATTRLRIDANGAHLDFELIDLPDIAVGDDVRIVPSKVQVIAN